MQSEFYTTGVTAIKASSRSTWTRAIDEKPTYVVFNGAVGALTGDRALQAKVGETRPALRRRRRAPISSSSFHVIGEIFDNVYIEGGSDRHAAQRADDAHPAGGAAIVEFGVENPATSSSSTTRIFRAFNKGALGMLHVTGYDNARVFAAIKGLGVNTKHGE